MADSWFQQRAAAPQRMNSNARATFSRRGRFHAINEAMPSRITEDMQPATNMERTRLASLMSSNTTVPPEHFKGLGSIEMKQPGIDKADVQAQYTQGAYNSYDEEIEPSVLESPYSVKDADNPRKKTELASTMAHEVGHHVDFGINRNNPDSRPYWAAANEARAENYSIKHTPMRHGMVTPVAYDSWMTKDARGTYPGGAIQNMADKLYYRATRASGQQPGDPYLDDTDEPGMKKLSKQFKAVPIERNDDTGWESLVDD